jgi:hypothetical protein
MSETNITCPFCDYNYVLFDRENEDKHLSTCPVFQSLPVSHVSPEGKTFVSLPGSENIYVERFRLN